MKFKSAFRNKLIYVFGVNDVPHKSTISFVVERDGSSTDVKANGPNKSFNAEAIRTVKSVKKKWSPAKINDQAVRYQYRLPLTMSF